MSLYREKVDVRYHDLNYATHVINNNYGDQVTHGYGGNYWKAVLYLKFYEGRHYDLRLHEDYFEVLTLTIKRAQVFSDYWHNCPVNVLYYH